MRNARLIAWLEEEAIHESFKPDCMRQSAFLYMAADKLREAQGLPAKNGEAIEAARIRYREYMGAELDLPEDSAA